MSSGRRERPEGSAAGIRMKEIQNRSYRLVIPLAACLILISVLQTSRAASPSAENKLRGLQTDKKEQTLLDKNTLAAAKMIGTATTRNGLSLLTLPQNAGSRGELFFQEYPGQSYRIQFAELSGDACFFWAFAKPMPLKNRWLRLTYSGISVPPHARIGFDSESEDPAISFDLYLDSSLVSRHVYFKLPDRDIFSAVQIIRLTFAPELMTGRIADFTISDLEIITEGDEPLAGVAMGQEQMGRYPQPFEPVKTRQPQPGSAL